MIRYALFVLNFFFALLGIGLVAIGAYVQINMAKYADFLGEQYLHASIVLIILGFVVAIVASFGCCGICTENPCLIYTYASMMSVILLSSIGVGISIFVYKVN